MPPSEPAETDSHSSTSHSSSSGGGYRSHYWPGTIWTSGNQSTPPPAQPQNNQAQRNTRGTAAQEAQKGAPNKPDTFSPIRNSRAAASRTTGTYGRSLGARGGGRGGS